MTTSSNLVFRPVRGYSENADFISRALGESQAKPLLEKIESGDCRARVLRDGAELKGFAVYDKNLGAVNTVSNALVLRSFYVSSKEDKSVCAEYRGALWNRVLTMVKEEDKLIPQNYVVTLNKIDEASVSWFSLKGFSKLSQDDATIVLSKRIQTLIIPRKTPVIAPSTQTPTAAVFAQPTETRKRPLEQEIRTPRQEPKRQSTGYRTVTLRREYIEMIAQGRKTIEGRVNTGSFAHIGPGTKIHFFAGAFSVDVVVKAVRKYKSFDDMLAGEGYEKCVPNAHNIQHASRIYADIPGYPERARTFGVVAFEIEKA